MCFGLTHYGQEDPSNKLYIFQFPHLFPNFLPSGSIDLTATAEDVKPDIKPTPTQLKAAGPGAPGKKSKSPPKPPPEGRIGTLVCTRKGRVKMVLGDGIVMDVSLGPRASAARSPGVESWRAGALEGKADMSR